MASIFYKSAFGRRFPITMFLLEHVQTIFTGLNKNEQVSEKDLFPKIKEALKDTGCVNNPSREDAIYVMERLTKMVEEAEKVSEDPPLPVKQTFASSYMQWVSKLDPDTVCLLAAGFDYFLAERLYKEVDKEDITVLSQQYLRCEWEKIKVGYESVVYGFGGSYKGDGDSGGDNAQTFDMTNDKEAALAAFKRLM